MALDLVTYESLRNVVVNWIKSNCSNIVNYNGINNSVKNVGHRESYTCHNSKIPKNANPIINVLL